MLHRLYLSWQNQIGRDLTQRLQNETAFVRWRLHQQLSRHGFVDIQIEPFDWLHPFTPVSLIRSVRAVGAVHPHLDTAVFDVPAVAARAPQGLVAHGGNFFEDALPDGFDIISLIRIMHDHDDEQVMKLLRNIARALPSNGRLLIAEPMAGTKSARAMGDGYFGLYLWAMGSGRPRTIAENCAMLRAAGLGEIRILPTSLPLAAQVILAGHTKA